MLRGLELILFLLICFQEYASTVRQIAQSSSMNMKDRLTIELHRKLDASSLYVCIVSDLFHLAGTTLIIQTRYCKQFSLWGDCNSKHIQSFHASIFLLPKYNY